MAGAYGRPPPGNNRPPPASRPPPTPAPPNGADPALWPLFKAVDKDGKLILNSNFVNDWLTSIQVVVSSASENSAPHS